MRTPRTAPAAAQAVVELLQERPRTLQELLAEFAPGAPQDLAAVALADLCGRVVHRTPDGVLGVVDDGPMAICPIDLR
ncbi:MAG: hypothetical protein WKG00_03445 [Polyangiaceae bacterium]